MTLFHYIRERARRFCDDTSGNVAIIFGLATVPLLLAAGSAVDIARGYVVQTRLQAALDAAALAAAAAVDLSEEERFELGATVFAANYDAGPLGGPASPVFTIDGNILTASVDASLETTLMNVAGVSELSVATSTEIAIPRWCWTIPTP